MRYLVLTIVMLLISTQAQAGKRYKYNELQIKNYDEMLEKVNKDIDAAKKITNQSEGDEGDQEAIDILTDSLTYVLSRPDKDNMVTKLVPYLKKELKSLNAFNEAIDTIVSNALTSLKLEKLPVIYRSTSIFILENVMGELKPELKTSTHVKSVFEKIKNEKIKISKDVVNNRKLTGMFRTKSPSITATTVLDKIFPKQKK